MANKSPLHESIVQAGATLAEGAGWLVPLHFGDPATEYRAACECAALFDLSARSKVAITGPEAVSFLNNLCTNDVKNLAPNDGCEAFLTTAKARVVAHFFVSRLHWQNSVTLLLDTSPGMAEKLLSSLNHYLISEQAELTDETQKTALLHLCGPNCRAILNAMLPFAVPDLAELQAVELPLAPGVFGWVRRHDLLGLPGYDLLVDGQAAVRVWEALRQAGAAPAGMQALATLRVEAGWPVFGIDMDENRLVMEVGRGRQAISYTKGCFLGQEPIVMARDRGHVNRSLLGLRIPEGGTVPAGSKVFHDGKEVGVVTSAVVSPRLGAAIALAYLQRGSQAPETAVSIETPAGPRPALVSALPFIAANPGPAPGTTPH